MVFILGWSRIAGFGVAWLKSNSGDNWMAKNRLFCHKISENCKILVHTNIIGVCPTPAPLDFFPVSSLEMTE